MELKLVYHCLLLDSSSLYGTLCVPKKQAQSKSLSDSEDIPCHALDIPYLLY